MPPWNELVIYEMHVGTFHRPEDDAPGTFPDVDRQVRPPEAARRQRDPDHAGDGVRRRHLLGLQPGAHLRGRERLRRAAGFKEFVKAAHASGFAVILDVVYNHFGPTDLDLWRFDGWSENDGGGIYFYNDWRRETPVGRDPARLRPRARCASSSATTR